MEQMPSVDAEVDESKDSGAQLLEFAFFHIPA